MLSKRSGFAGRDSANLLEVTLCAQLTAVTLRREKGSMYRVGFLARYPLSLDLKHGTVALRFVEVKTLEYSDDL